MTNMKRNKKPNALDAKLNYTAQNNMDRSNRLKRFSKYELEQILESMVVIEMALKRMNLKRFEELTKNMKGLKTEVFEFYINNDTEEKKVIDPDDLPF